MCIVVYIILEVLQDFPYIFGCSYVRCIYVYNVYVFLMDSSLEYYEGSSGSLFMAFVLNLFFSDVNTAILIFFSISMEHFSQPLTFSLCRSFVLRWVSCKQNMCGSHFLIHSAPLCLLIGTFNQFTFKVIIDRCLFIAILLPLYLFSSLSHSFFSSFIAVPLSYLAVLVGWTCILSAFFHLGNSLFHLLF